MRRISIIAGTLAVAATATVSSCDEGRIYPSQQEATQGGRTVKVTARLSGRESWEGAESHIALAGFSANGSYAEVSKNISGAGSQDGGIVLAGIPDEVTELRVCAIDRLRKQVAEFASFDLTGYDGRDTIRLDAGTLDVSMTAAVETEIFQATCSACHGGSNHSAAGLHLGRGLTASELTGVASTVVSGGVRVVAGKPEESVLYQALSGDLSREWRYDHSVEVVDPSRLTLIKEWIESLGKQAREE